MIHIPHTWLYFWIALGIAALSSWLMGRQGRFFFTKDPLRRRFSILEMEFPAKSFELETLINGIYLLPDDAPKTIRSLKNQLLLDYFLFVPAAYGGIYILCMHIASHMETTIGRSWFVGLAWAQLISFALDYIENTYFWVIIGRRNIPIPTPDITKPEAESASFRMLQLLETFKWGIALVGIVCCISVLVYFWLSATPCSIPADCHPPMG